MGFRNKNPRARKKMWEEGYMGFKIVLGKSDPKAWGLIREQIDSQISNKMT